MRTTLDLPDELYELARQLAHDGNKSMSEVISELIWLGVRRSRSEVAVTARGLPQLSVGRPITVDDVRSLDDDG